MPEESTFIVVNPHGDVIKVSGKVANLCGIPQNQLLNRSLSERLLEEHRIRFEAELRALTNGDERHGRMHCTMIGLDGIGRRLTMILTLTRQRNIHVVMLPYQHPDSVRTAPGASLLDQGRLLPVTRRIAGLSKQATDKAELLRGSLDIFAEVTAAESAAVLEWDLTPVELPIATSGPFEESSLRGVFRPSILTRLARGDVVIKESHLEDHDNPTSMILVPLLSAAAPLGIIVLVVRGYLVLVPEEQQSLVILGEIVSLGLQTLQSSARAKNRYQLHRGDSEATMSLGRFSAGLAHEINNAATVLRNTIEQFTQRRNGYGPRRLTQAAVEDSLSAIEAIRDLTDAMRAFAPEETGGLEEVDIDRTLEMVVRTVRFYAKHSVVVEFDPPEEKVPKVLVHSHFLIRSLFLVFVELGEAAADSGRTLEATLKLSASTGIVTFTIAVNMGPFNIPTVLLSQLEKGGALTRHVTRAGGALSYNVDHQGNLSMSIAMPEAQAEVETLPSPAQTSSLRRGTILIADDEVAIIRSLRRVLERYHDVLAADSGEEAIGIIESHPSLDLVLYDASMPRLPGPEFFEEVKRHQSKLVDRVIFVSGGAADAKIAQFLNETANPVVEKPFDLAKLNELISSMIV